MRAPISTQPMLLMSISVGALKQLVLRETFTWLVRMPHISHNLPPCTVRTCLTGPTTFHHVLYVHVSQLSQPFTMYCTYMSHSSHNLSPCTVYKWCGGGMTNPRVPVLNHTRTEHYKTSSLYTAHTETHN